MSSRAVSLKERCNALEEKLPNAITRTTNAVITSWAVQYCGTVVVFFFESQTKETTTRMIRLRDKV